METNKGGFKKRFGFLSSNFMKLCRNIQHSVWQLWIFVFWWSFWIQNGGHSKPTIIINLQHHNLLGNQISPKTAIILNFFNLPKAATHYVG
jgi:hypothetical protein